MWGRYWGWFGLFCFLGGLFGGGVVGVLGGGFVGPCLVDEFAGGSHFCDEVVAVGDVLVDCLGGVVVAALGDVFDEGFGVGGLGFGGGGGVCVLGGELFEEVGCGCLGCLGVVFGGV